MTVEKPQPFVMPPCTCSHICGVHQVAGHGPDRKHGPCTAGIGPDGARCPCKHYAPEVTS